MTDQPQQVRDLSPVEQQRWDGWLKAALKAERERMIELVAHGVGETHNQFLEKELEPALKSLQDQINELKRENLELRANMTRKAWWR